MKQCPVCAIDLEPVEYEGFRVMQCRRCGGHLVPLQRLDAIKRVDRKSPDELKAEATAGFTESTPDTLSCPRCHMRMRKQTADLPVLELSLDLCQSCKLAWLDGGELALFQLGYQAKSKFIDAREFKRRMQELEASPERKARFEKDLARLPRTQDPFKDAFHEILEEVGEAFFRALLRSGF